MSSTVKLQLNMLYYERSSVRRRTGEDGKSLIVTRVTERNAHARSNGEVVDVLAGDIKGDRHGEERAIGKTEIVNDAVRTYEICPDTSEP